MVKMTKLGKYRNSPPEKVIYYNAESFFKFISDYIAEILIVYAEETPPQFTMNNNGEFIISYLDGSTYIYSEVETKEDDKSTIN